MKYRFLALIAALALTLGMFGSAVAGSANHTEPGTPGEKNCVGQTMAYLAQVGQPEGIPGIGNLAREADLSVKEVKAIVEEYCAS